MQQWQAEWHAELDGNGVEGFGQIGLFQSVDNPYGVVAELGAQHFHAHGSGHAEPHEAVLAYPQLSREVVEGHAVAFGLDVEVGGEPFEGLGLGGRDGFLARGARRGHEDKPQECYFCQRFHKEVFFKSRSKKIYFAAKI